MSVCLNCRRNEPRPTTHAHLTREFYGVLIAPLRFVARKHGYALAVHGSLGMDIDLIAVPWRDSPTDPEDVAEAIRKTAEQIIGTAEMRLGGPRDMPLGRRAWSFYLGPEGCDVPYIDLSVMPPAPGASEGK